MSKVRDYLLAVDNDKARALSIAHATAQGTNPSQIAKHFVEIMSLAELQNRQTTLLDVVQSLSEYINDENEKVRSKAVSYLTAVLSGLPQNHLTRQQIQVLCQFFCDRIEDGGAIEGLSRLQGLGRFNNDMAQAVVRA
jgi:DNA repair/transcription protein MET18/MMS19